MSPMNVASRNAPNRVSSDGTSGGTLEESMESIVLLLEVTCMAEALLPRVAQ